MRSRSRVLICPVLHKSTFRYEKRLVQSTCLHLSVDLYIPCPEKSPNSSHYCYCLVTKSRPTLCDPMDCIPPGSSVHGILQARTLDWVAVFFSRGSPQPRDLTCISFIAGGFFTIEPLRKPKLTPCFLINTRT